MRDWELKILEATANGDRWDISSILCMCYQQCAIQVDSSKTFGVIASQSPSATSHKWYLVSFAQFWSTNCNLRHWRHISVVFYFHFKLQVAQRLWSAHGRSFKDSFAHRKVSSTSRSVRAVACVLFSRKCGLRLLNYPLIGAIELFLGCIRSLYSHRTSGQESRFVYN